MPSSHPRLTPAEILQYLTTELALEPEGLTPETALFSSGRLDSLAMVDLLLFLETQTGLRIEPGDVTQERFDSVQAMLAFLCERAADGTDR